MAKSKKKLLSIKNRVLIYLSRIPNKYRDSFDAPFSLTQMGIANNIGIRRKNVPQEVNALIKEGLVESRKVHVYGVKQRRNIYYLTPMGYKRASEINSELSKVMIDVIMLDGSKERYYIKDIPNLLPFDVSYNEIIRNINNSMLDCNDIHKKKILDKKRFLDCSNGFADPPYFFGRKGEMKETKTWFDSKTSNILVVTGIAGIGKSTFIAEQVREWNDKYPVNCFKIHEWTSLGNVLENLGDFLSPLGKKGPSNYAHTHEKPDMAELQIIFEKALKDLDAIIVFDDCHNINPDITLFFKMLYEVFQTTETGKLVTIGRSVPSFYNRGKGKISGNVKEMVLTGLDKESCRLLLSELGFSQENMDELYSSTKGHPLFIELSEGRLIGRSKNIKKYILDEYLSNLGDDESDVLRFISVMRYPVEELAIAPNYGALKSLLSKGVLHELPDGTYELHDIIKEYLYDIQRNKQLKKNHSDAADFYIEQEGLESVLEAIFHRTKADEFDLASELAIEHGTALIKHGHSAELSGLIVEILSIVTNSECEIKLRLILGEAFRVTGGWDDALEHFNVILTMGKELDDKKAIAKVHLNVGEIHLLRDNRIEATTHLNEALRLYTESKDDKGIAEIKYLQGVIHERAGDYDKALQMFIKCEIIAEDIGDSFILAKSLNASGRIYNLKGDYEEALKIKEKALYYVDELDDQKELAKIYIGLGTCAFNIRDINKAITFYTTASEISEELGDIRVLGHALTNLASSYIDNGDLALATENLEKAKYIFTKLGEDRRLSSVYLTYAVVWSASEKWSRAIEDFETCIRLRKEVNDLTGLVQAKYKFGLFYKNKGEIEKARELFKEAIELAIETGENHWIQEITLELNELSEG